MKNLILAFGIFFCFSNGFAQRNDSLQLLFQLDTFNIEDTTSLKSYDSLLFNSKFRFPPEVKITYHKKGLRHAEVLKFFEKSEAVVKANELNGIFTNLANLYHRSEQFDSLKFYLEKSIEQLHYFENLDLFSYATATAYKEATFLYMRLEEYEFASIFLEKAGQYLDFLPNYDLLKFDYCLNTRFRYDNTANKPVKYRHLLVLILKCPYYSLDVYIS